MMYGYYNDYGYGGWNGANMMGWFGGGIMMVVFWVLLIGLVVWLVREVRGGGVHHNSSQALNILKERYAKGEITKEEFDSKKKDLA